MGYGSKLQNLSRFLFWLNSIRSSNWFPVVDRQVHLWRATIDSSRGLRCPPRPPMQVPGLYGTISNKSGRLATHYVEIYIYIHTVIYSYTYIYVYTNTIQNA